MERCSFRFTSCALILVCTFWSGISTATAQPPPEDVENVIVVGQTETSVTIQFDKVVDIPEYRLYYGADDPENITAGDNNPIRYTLHDLSPAQKYSMILRSKAADGRESAGYSFIAVTAPENPIAILSVNPGEDTISLHWSEVPGVTEYIIQFTREIHVTGRTTETITDLESGTLYRFTVFAVFENVRSSGTKFSAATAPPQVSSVKTTARTLTTVTLEWQSVRNDFKYLVKIDGRSETIGPKAGLISHTVSALEPGTVYPFSITTVFEPEFTTTSSSQPLQVYTATEVSWHVTETTIQGKVYGGPFNSVTASNGTQLHSNSGSSPDIKFTGLYPGATYTIKLTTWGGQEQYSHSITLIPPRLTAKCKNWNSGYSIYLEWDSPSGVWDSVEFNVSDEMHEVANNVEHHAILPDFHPAKKYKVSISSQSGPQKSTPYVFMCKTDDRVVIAGAFFGVLSFLILVGAVVFVVLRRPDIIRRTNSAIRIS